MLIPPQRRGNIKELFWAVQGHHVKRNFSHLLERSEKGSISCSFRLARGHVAETAPSKHSVFGLIVLLFCARRWDKEILMIQHLRKRKKLFSQKASVVR